MHSNHCDDGVALACMVVQDEEKREDNRYEDTTTAKSTIVTSNNEDLAKEVLLNVSYAQFN